MEGEAAFVRGEMERALEHYERAAKLNPKMYEAPLFTGDVYFKMGKIDKAGESYARAIAINPDLDTAYRYWGNVLMEAGKLKEAREKLIEAVVAQPYIRAPWEFLAKWGERSKVELGHPRVEIAGSMSAEKDATTIAIDPKSAGKADGSGLWMLYHTRRSQWIKEKFAREFPGEKEYRHSLREEADALGLVANLATESLKDGRLKEKDLDVSIANLLRIHKAGLLEAFILLARADDGIARDYPEYRKTNRDRLRQYLNEFVTAPR
jgi:tetratricopeptide (TPR) repeat protein